MSHVAIQERLADLGYYRGKIDGILGSQTKAAVKEFQLDMGLKADGIVGPITERALFPERKEPTQPVKMSTTYNTIMSHKRATRPITEVIVHCTATPEGREVTVETIRSWHVGKGWKDIGYHWVVGLDGVVREGRPEAQIGSHVAGHNTNTLGIVYVGGVGKDGKTPKDTRTAGQKETLLEAVKTLIAKYPSIVKVTGHNQYASKACPSFDVRKDPLGQLL